MFGGTACMEDYLLFKVAGTFGKVILELGSDDEGIFVNKDGLMALQVAGTFGKTILEVGSDDEGPSTEAAWEALGRVVGSLQKDVLFSFIKAVRDALEIKSEEKERYLLFSMKETSRVVVFESWANGAVEMREQAALGLGELIALTNLETLKEFVIPVTRYHVYLSLLTHLVKTGFSKATQSSQICLQPRQSVASQDDSSVVRRRALSGIKVYAKVFSWEPIVCHDNVDVGWSRLSYTNVHEGKLLGCSYNQSCVGVWVVDLSVHILTHSIRLKKIFLLLEKTLNGH
ncbi:hypothetical protein ZIOFF_022036 [Zingiber officinale]|uniref:Uncharacterized protein n=1 Tax=Zingiber officinale TaxID=94328 RepID=A0A8J5HKT9_ZINOF|nr:hypothetical protein ZIOFF_022036 [Zingiber officinale]